MFFKTRDILIFIFLGALVFSIIIFIGDYQKVKSEFFKIRFSTLLVLLLFSFGNYLVRFLKWSIFLRMLSIKVKSSDSMLIFFAGLSMALTPGKLGETIKSYLLRTIEKVGLKTSLPIILIERLTDLFGLIFLSLLGASTVINFKIMIPLLIIFVTSIFLMRSTWLFDFFVRFVSKINFFKKRLDNISQLHMSLKNLLSARSFFISIPLSVVSWGLEGIAFYLLITSLGFDFSVFQIVSIYSFSVIVGSLAFIPGGLGVTEGSLLSLLAFIGMPLSTASLATIIIRLTTLWFGILIGLLSLLAVSRRTASISH